ncbi:MAG TPA: phenylalanine--tRNA ligase subunit beta, partial [Candidatus Binatia bacterium]|nr:phenylalanine--tRNA ligase subunit beta [Candidatus Binatia bacterium]
EEILELFGLERDVGYVRCSSRVFHPGRAARVLWGGKTLGELGQTHPEFCAEVDLPPCVLFELDFDGLVQYSRPRTTFHPLPRFPSVERDFAVVVDENFPAQRIVDWIHERGLALIERVEVFDQYGGSPIPEGKKSLAYKVSYRAEDRTLTDAEVTSLHQDLVARIGATFDAQLRT